MKCDLCPLPAYYVTSVGRGFCTQLHAQKGLAITPNTPVRITPEVNGHRGLTVVDQHDPPRLPPIPLGRLLWDAVRWWR